MNRLSCLRVNEPKVVAEAIDGEVVIINLETGSYYSTDKVGAEIWNALDGSTPAEIAVELASRYAAADGEIEEAVVDFAAQLRDEELISVIEEEAARPEPSAATSLGGAVALSFSRPDLQKYEDMQDLLLADPIHDFEDTSWPKAAEPKSSRQATH